VCSALVALGLAVVLGAGLVEAGEGTATWYGQQYHGRSMANGQIFDMNDPTTAASREFALGTWLRVTSVASNATVEVEVRDRGSFAHALDLSYAAFARIASPSAGIARVRYEVIPGPGRAPAAAAPLPPPAPRAPTPPVAPRAIEPGPGRHTVEAGDTLASIARRYSVTVAELVEWNELSDPDTLRAGWVLRVESPSAAPVAAGPAVAAVSVTATGEGYVVQEGDTLSRIADRFQVDSTELARANGIGPDGVIRVGQSLAIPMVAWYRIEPGDTLASIAAQCGTTVDALVRLNGLENPDHLVVGQSIRVR
jgi:LysM repeat protein